MVVTQQVPSVWSVESWHRDSCAQSSCAQDLFKETGCDGMAVGLGGFRAAGWSAAVVAASVGPFTPLRHTVAPFRQPHKSTWGLRLGEPEGLLPL